MSFVLDASVFLSRIYGDEGRPDALHIIDAAIAQDALVPAIWWYEVRNSLLVNERVGRLDAELFDLAYAQIRMLSFRTDEAAPREDVVLIARRGRLKIYDAIYLELALRTGLPLASFDVKQRAAAKAEGVPLFEAA